MHRRLSSRLSLYFACLFTLAIRRDHFVCRRCAVLCRHSYQAVYRWCERKELPNNRGDLLATSAYGHAMTGTVRRCWVP
jgi:hypothetical protein